MNDREKMGLKGPVKKIETVSITTTPLGEMVTFYPEEKSKVQCIDGDVMVVFTENGDIDSFHIYGQENKELFAAVKDGREKEKTPIIIPEPSFYQEMNQMSCVCYYDSLQRPISIVYSKNNIENQKITFKYFGTSGGYERVTNYKFFADTIRFLPTKFDEYSNWVEGEKSYVGLVTNHKDKYTIHRQISYYGDEEKVVPILLKYNKKEILERSNKQYSWSRENIENIFSMKIPDCFVKDNSNRVQNAFKNVQQEYANEYGFDLKKTYQFNYNEEDAFSTINITISNRPEEASYMTYDNLPENQLAYDEETDKFFKSSIIDFLHSEGKELLIWKPFLFTRVGNHIALQTHFYRWDESPFPMEFYRFHIPLPNGKDIHLSFYWLSNHTAQFEPLKKRIIESIQFLQ